MIALLSKLPSSKLFGVFMPSVDFAQEQAHLAMRNGATFAAVVTGKGRIVERIREGGLHGIGKLETYAEEEH